MVRVSTGRPWVRPRNADQLPLWKYALVSTLATPEIAPKSRVVPLPLARDKRVHAVVEVIVPLRVEPVAARLPGRDQPGVVEVGLGHQGERPSGRRGEGVHRDRQFLEDVQRAVVHQRVHRVEAEPVEVVVPQPRQRVLHDERAHLIGARLVQVDRRAPRRHVRVGEVRPERGEPVARPDMVVDDIEVDGEPARVAGVHEPLQRVRPAVGLVHRPQADPVVPPAMIAGERGQRHQLDHRHAEIREVVQTLDGGVQRPLRGERADVQLVDHRAGERRAAPVPVRPRERRVVVGPARARPGGLPG